MVQHHRPVVAGFPDCPTKRDRHEDVGVVGGERQRGELGDFERLSDALEEARYLALAGAPSVPGRDGLRGLRRPVDVVCQLAQDRLHVTPAESRVESPGRSRSSSRSCGLPFLPVADILHSHGDGQAVRVSKPGDGRAAAARSALPGAPDGYGVRDDAGGGARRSSGNAPEPCTGTGVDSGVHASGPSGLKVSRIALGCMSFGDTSRGFNEWALDDDGGRTDLPTGGRSRHHVLGHRERLRLRHLRGDRRASHQEVQPARGRRPGHQGATSRCTEGPAGRGCPARRSWSRSTPR